MLNIIANPFAGNGKAKVITKKIARILKSKKLPFLIYFSEKKGDIKEYATKLYNDGVRSFIVVGGDGTLHQFVNAFENIDEITFGIIPAGSCNNFAESLNIPSSVKNAIDIILEEKISKVDYMLCNDIVGLNCFSLGISTEILKTMKCSKFKINYFFWATRFMNKFDGIRLNIKAHKFNFENKRFSELVICNGKFYGNKISINPLANLEDGKLNLIATDMVGEKKNLNKVISLFNNAKHIYNPLTLQSWSEKIDIENEEHKLEATIDGEYYEFEKVTISTVPKKLSIYCNIEKETNN